MKIIDSISRELWDEVVRNVNYATFYHTPMWAQIMREAFPKWRIATKGLIFEDGTRAILPLMSTSVVPGLKKGGEVYLNMYPVVYGGVISEGELTGEKMERIAGYLHKLAGTLTAQAMYIGNPFQKEPISLQSPFQKEDMFTQTLRLDAGFEQIWKNLNHGHKCSIEQARKLGVVVERAKTIEDYRAYFEVYQDTLKRFGEKTTMAYPYELFEAFGKAETEDIILWLARLGNKVIGGTLVVYCNRHASPWHAASLTDYLDYRPNNVVHIEAIRDACERKYLYYDFCPSSGLKGVETFKKRFGAERMDFSLYRWDNPLFKKAQEIKSWLLKTSQGIKSDKNLVMNIRTNPSSI